MLQLLTEDDLYVGLEIMARFKNTTDDAVWGDEFIPLRVVNEYPHFFICEVLPHINKYGVTDARAYNMTINKQDLRLRNVVCRYNLA